MNRLLLLLPTLWLVACSDITPSDVALVEVAQQHLKVKLDGRGELISANQIKLTAPQQSKESLTLAWLAEENSFAEAGQVVAKFDGKNARLNLVKSQRELKKVELNVENKRSELALQQLELTNQRAALEQELAIAERFDPSDLAGFSKNEIIDKQQNQVYLQAQKAFLDWQFAQAERQLQAELDVLQVQADAHHQKIQQQQEILAALSIKAPQSGVVVYQKNWRGDKIRPGGSIWPGREVLSIAQSSQPKAELYVLESQALGLQPGLTVQLQPQAYPELWLQGKIERVAGVASPNHPDDPVRYFKVLVEFTQDSPKPLKLGQKVEAKIEIASLPDAITIPNQAVFASGQQQWVFVKNGMQFERRDIELGVTGLALSQVKQGLVAGEQVALLMPKSLISNPLISKPLISKPLISKQGVQ